MPPAPGHLRRAVRISTAALLLGVLVCVLALRRETLAVRPDLLAALVGALLAVAAANVPFVLADLRSGRIGRVRAGAAILFLAGALLAGGDGLHAWLSRVQGFVLLQEGEPALLASPARLAEFEAGPLAAREELGATAQLERLELHRAGGGALRPVSRVRIVDPVGRPSQVQIEGDAPARFGGLALRHGAFGVAPRITVTHGDLPVFDGPVPLTAGPERGGEVTFSGAVPVHAAGLLVTGSVTAAPDGDGPDPQLRIRLADERDPLGEATLRVGDLAELAKGYRVRFSGLHRWSEIEVSRRPRPEPLCAGVLLALIGAAIWPVAAWKRW